MSWITRQSCVASPGGSTALLILITRPSTCATTPSSSSCSEPGRTTSACCAVSLRKKSITVKNSSFSSARDEGVVGEGDLRVEADRQEALDLARVDLPHHLVAVD